MTGATDIRLVAWLAAVMRDAAYCRSYEKGPYVNTHEERLAYSAEYGPCWDHCGPVAGAKAWASYAGRKVGAR